MPTVLEAADAARWLRSRVRGALRTDSRRVGAGDGFVAWPGYAVDARRFVPDAQAAGAAACLVERDGVEAFGFDDPRIASLTGLKAAAGPVADAYFGQPSRALDVVAVTGTNGKTSTAWWTAQALGALGRRCGLVGTLGVGEPPPAAASKPRAPGEDRAAAAPALDSTGLTTPDPVQLHAALRRFADTGCRACALEASSIGIAEHRLDGVRVAVALFTNLTPDHLDYHGDMDRYWAAKRRLFDWEGLRAAVVNVDDPHGAALADELRRSAGVDLWTVSTAGDARLRAVAPAQAGEALAFDVVEGALALPVRCPGVHGAFNATNLLLVAGALRALGVPLADAVAVLPRLTPVPGRMQRVAAAGVEASRVPAVVVDYAHTPDALDKALRALRPLAAARRGRLWCVFGCGGNRDAGKRPVMGAVAAALADVVVLTSDNPRDESPAAIIAEVAAGIAERRSLHVVEDRRDAIAFALREAAAPDVVLLAGKGHEDYQETRGVRRAFSDVDEAAAALRARAGR
jgi:UDP-N-acetylmuramoyl-L-alanyl-D-glutamate--2,6-diaminopimelate ligase